MRILLADDQKEFRLLAQRYLESKGHEVVAVASGEEALRLLEQGSFDTMLLDEEMPGMTGGEVLQRVRTSQAKLRHIPVIAMTGYNTEQDRERLLRAGFDSVIGKPFRFELLEAVLGAVTAGKIAAPGEPLGVAEPSRTKDALARLGGDEQLLKRLAATFLKDLPARIGAIQRFISEKRGEDLASSAHALKGALGIFGADRAAGLCRQLQILGQNANFAEAATIYVALKEAIAELQADLRGYAGKKRAAGPEALRPAKTRRLPGAKRKKP